MKYSSFRADDSLSSYEAEGPNIMKYSLLIIGAWLDGSSESKEFALTSHGKLHDQISQQLVCKKRF
jgi:hypothetical protein